MAVKLNPAKARFVTDLLKSQSNRFTPDELENAAGTPRRARSALFHARLAGITLEAIRDGGRAVVAYVCNDSALPTITATAKPAKAASAKAVAKAKPVKSAKQATVERMAKEVVAKAAKPKVRVTKAMQKTVAADVAKSDAEAAAIKEANLATMRAVTAKQNKAKAKSRLTEEQESIREEFYAEEAELARIEERAALRNNAPAFLFKESYSE